ncbi:MAG: hypothetical protein JXR76_17935 [Deltaproteobacteria bacterium]|nr:hypothetical protein [Deltaproteobacteria bacterium]
MLNYTRRLILPAVAILVACAMLACGGAGKLKTNSPIAAVPEMNRITMEEFDGNPVAVRLTQPAVVAGIMLPPGSIMRQTSETKCSIFPAENLLFGNMQIPAASELELVSAANGYQWSGIVILGEAAQYQGIMLRPGDGAFFTGPLLTDPILTQIRTGMHGELVGQWYPKDTIIFLDPAGAVTGVTAPISPEALAAQQESYLKQKAERTARCEEICAQHKSDVAAHTKCMEYCLSR